MNIQDILARILNSGQAPQNQLATAGQQQPQNALASRPFQAASMFAPSNPDSAPRMPQAMKAPAHAPMGAMAPAQGVQQGMPAQTAPAAPQGAPAPSRGGGIGDFIGNIIAPQRAAKNQTIQYLTQQGLDEGTATLLAGNKPALQKFLLDRSQGADPMDALKQEKTRLEIDQLRNPTTTDIKEYQFAKQEGYEGTLTDFMQDMKKAGATNVTTNVGGGETAGWKKIDEAFADTYLSWQSGGFADSVKQLDQLGEALGILESGQDVTGAIGLIPEIAQPFINEQGTVAREAVEEVVQRNLREILGAQFTEKEGERLISRAFNPRLRPEENAKRVRRLISQVGDMAKSKQAMVDYFDQNGTLRGYTGPRPSKADLDNIDFGDDAGGALPEGVSEEDLEFTMKKHGLTREEVLERLNAR